MTVLDLPEAGYGGNSHLPMLDDNSDRIAALVRAWFETAVGEWKA